MGIRHSNLVLDTFSCDVVTENTFNKLLGTIAAQLHYNIAGLMFPMGGDSKVSFKCIILLAKKFGMTKIRVVVKDDKEHGWASRKPDRERCYDFTYSEPWLFSFYSSLRPDRSRLISYDILTVLSVSLTAEFPLTDYFSHDYSSWLITYDTLSQIDLVCAPDPLVYKPSVQTVFL